MPVNSSPTLREWLTLNIAFPLNDCEPNHEFTRYPLPVVLAALNEGLATVSQLRPDLYTDLKVVKLAPGTHQDVRGCCGAVYDIIEQVDSLGNIIKPLTGARKTNTTAKKKWTKPSCIVPEGADGGYVVTGIDINSTLNGRFDVWPPVPCDVEAYVRIKCASTPCRYIEADLNMPFDGSTVPTLATKHYILGTLMMGDRFANAGAVPGQGAWHIKRFYEVLGLMTQAEEKYESPSKAGEEQGLNDKPNVARRSS